MARTVFVSSTFVDLRTHRKSIWDMLTSFDVTVRGMEQFGARTETPLQTCLVEVDQSDIYVGVIGFRAGSIEPSSGKSFTQLEYERAYAHSKTILIYLIDEENSRVPFKFIDAGESREKLVAFKSVLRERHTVDTFVNEMDLIEKLKRDLERHIQPLQNSNDTEDPFSIAAERLRIFALLPKSVAGTEVRLRVRLSGSPYPASRSVCDAFNMEFGATVGLPVDLVLPSGVRLPDVPDLYVHASVALELLPLSRGDEIEGFMKLHFSAGEISEVRARYRPRTEYPESSLKALGGIASVLGKPTHHAADSRLAIELSKLLTCDYHGARPA